MHHPNDLQRASRAGASGFPICRPSLISSNTLCSCAASRMGSASASGMQRAVYGEELIYRCRRGSGILCRARLARRSLATPTGAESGASRSIGPVSARSNAGPHSIRTSGDPYRRDAPVPPQRNAVNDFRPEIEKAGKVRVEPRPTWRRQRWLVFRPGSRLKQSRGGGETGLPVGFDEPSIGTGIFSEGRSEAALLCEGRRIEDQSRLFGRGRYQKCQRAEHHCGPAAGDNRPRLIHVHAPAPTWLSQTVARIERWSRLLHYLFPTGT